jgi:hypothetical protein
MKSMKKIKCYESGIYLSDLNKIKSLKHSKSATSWIDYYHKGVPAFTIEDGYFTNGSLPHVKLIKFNIYCFREEIIKEIVPSNYRLAQDNDWEKIFIDRNELSLMFHNKLKAEHYSFISLSENYNSQYFINSKPDKSIFIRDFDRTIFFKFKNVIVDNEYKLHYQFLVDFAGYPRFMLKLIENKAHSKKILFNNDNSFEKTLLQDKKNTIDSDNRTEKMKSYYFAKEELVIDETFPLKTTKCFEEIYFEMGLNDYSQIISPITIETSIEFDLIVNEGLSFDFECFSIKVNTIEFLFGVYCERWCLIFNGHNYVYFEEIETFSQSNFVDIPENIIDLIVKMIKRFKEHECYLKLNQYFDFRKSQIDFL